MKAKEVVGKRVVAIHQTMGVNRNTGKREAYLDAIELEGDIFIFLGVRELEGDYGIMATVEKKEKKA